MEDTHQQEITNIHCKLSTDSIANTYFHTGVVCSYSHQPAQVNIKTCLALLSLLHWLTELSSHWVPPISGRLTLFFPSFQCGIQCSLFLNTYGNSNTSNNKRGLICNYTIEMNGWRVSQRRGVLVYIRWVSVSVHRHSSKPASPSPAALAAQHIQWTFTAETHSYTPPSLRRK